MSISKKASVSLLAAIALAVAALTVTPSTAWALEIRVKDQATVRGGTITLGDIASFTPETDPRVEMLARMDVASAPSPGNGVNLNRTFLSYKIGSSLSGKEDILLEIPATITVRRTANTIPGSQLDRIFRDHVRSHAPWDPKRLVFEKVDVPEAVALPEGRVHWEILERGGDRYLGHVAVTINFFVDGKQVRNVPVSGKITVRQEVVKAARRISPGQTLGREHVTLVAEQSSNLQRDVLTNLEDVLGKRAVRSIQPGQPITSQMTEDPPVVKKGTGVLILAQSELIRVSTRGKAMEDGRLGEEVRIMNLRSGKEIFATVKGPGLVKVTF
ncbi:MAG: flagellar basal body P-ring formation protein FlgA [Deltaproteobacteria bacterium]|nr:flagellar basal body P-ring formation protein FlgA [Deltaproteobacteria bacterium]